MGRTDTNQNTETSRQEQDRKLALAMQAAKNEYRQELKRRSALYRKTYRERLVAKINKVLSIVLGLLIFFSVLSYYFITSSEVKLNKLRKETLAINDENMELQNHLDYLKSYTNVNKRIQSQNIVQKAQEVVQVSTPAVVEPEKEKRFLGRKKNTSKENIRPKRVEKFKWSLGY